MTWEEFLTTKFGLWIGTRLSIDNTIHGSGRIVEKSGILLQIEKVPEASNGDLTCYVFKLEDALAHFNVTDPSRILTIEKQGLGDCEIRARPRTMNGVSLDQNISKIIRVVLTL